MAGKSARPTKLLPLAAELVNVPAIPTAETKGISTDAALQSMVAGLTVAEKKSLLETIRRSMAG